MAEKGHDWGLQPKAMTDRIVHREDCMYKADVVRNVIEMYLDECCKAISDGEKICLKSIGTLQPQVHSPKQYNIPWLNGSENLPYTSVRFQRTRRLRDIMNKKFVDNLKNNFPGLGEKCMCNTQQSNSLIKRGYMEGEEECTEQ